MNPRIVPCSRARPSSGNTFTLGSLAAVTSIPEQELEPRLRALIRREALTLRADPRQPERGQYAFAQGLLREVAYSTLTRDDRRVRHLAAARHFESLGSDELAGALAVQYESAYRNSKPGPETEALGVQARLALKAAGERAMGLGSPEHAQGLFAERGEDIEADVVPIREWLRRRIEAGEHEHRSSLRAVDGSVAFPAGRWVEAFSAYREASDLDPYNAPAMNGEAAVAALLGRDAAAAGEALAALKATGSHGTFVKLGIRMAQAGI